ncbi:MAG: 2,3-bisphosphoglycerate-independent phosphoglycerate mutase [Desulfobacteraceae bacterium]|nr:MAG: 2,3-bisphosphoglycerate-independent phosphoglycerate mutase [Desulfobacteraceae bacterium]
MDHQPRGPVNGLIILDGWGISPSKNGNAVACAHTPFLDSLIDRFPHSQLQCSGLAVGLPENTMGNSEVGHMNIGAGRKVFQDLVRINQAIEDRSFFANPALVDLMSGTRKKKAALHLIGLLSDGGVHSHMSHLYALIDMAVDQGLERIYIHPILDGRDTPPKSGITYITELERFLSTRPQARIATVCGRYWAMDRDTRWDRVERAYNLLTQGMGHTADRAEQALQQAYENGETDEFVSPIRILEKTDETGPISDHDGIVFFNFRADRAKQITRAFTEKTFDGFKRSVLRQLGGFVCMTQYDESFDLPVAFGPVHLDNILGEVMARSGLRQLRLAETEKYAHVTYFFNGGDEKIFQNEERVLIPSPRDVATYDEKPEMSAVQVARTASEKIRNRDLDFMVLNFANMDMVGHTGILDAAVRACETVDQCVRTVVEAIWETQGWVLITADHGNSETMIQPDGSPHTAHTLNPVQLILAGHDHMDATLSDGILGDIAPTILTLLGIDPPPEMTGASLL